MSPLSGGPIDLLLRNCRLLDVYTGEIRPANIAVGGGRILSNDAPGDATATEIIECDGMYATPGLIDAHMHVDTTFLWSGEVARTFVPLGTTTIFVDTTNIAHTGGPEVIEGLMRSFEGLPIRGIFAAPSYCPLNSKLETAAMELTSGDIKRLLDAGCVSIGETVWSRISLGDDDFFRGIQICRAADKRVSGHGGEIARGDEAAMDAYVAAGLQDDHCLMHGDDVLPRLRRGLRLFCVEAPGREGQLRRILTFAKERGIPLRHLSLCVDNITVMDLIADGFGYHDHLIRIALEVGIAPVEAFRMATLNPAEHYRVADTIGSLAPGRAADILLMKAFDAFPPEIVIVRGRVVASKGSLLVDIPKPNFPASYRNSIDLRLVKRSSFAVRTSPDAMRARVRVIKVKDAAAFNTAVDVELSVVGGEVQPDVSRDILRMVVVERYGRNGNVGGGFVNGFGLKRGAIATSLSIPSNNIVAVGASEEDLWCAVARLGETQGGFVVVEGGRPVAEVPLPFGGIMAECPFEETIEQITRATEAAHRLGCRLPHPFYTMAQTVLSTLPELGLTDQGLVDSTMGKTVPVVLEEAVP
jgi:adenine deaminase